MNTHNKEILLGDYPREIKEAALSLIRLQPSDFNLNLSEPSVFKLKCKFEKDEVSYIRRERTSEDDYRIYWAESNSRKPKSRIILLSACPIEMPGIEIDKNILQVKLTIGVYNKESQFEVVSESFKLYHRSALSTLIELSK